MPPKHEANTVRRPRKSKDANRPEATTPTDDSPLVEDWNSEDDLEDLRTATSSSESGRSTPPIPTTNRPFFDEDQHSAVAIVQEVYNMLKEDVKFENICPKIVFIGSQSSGKTSLFTTMTGYPLPANEGMATRCAMSFTVEGGKVDNPSLAVKRSRDKLWTPVNFGDPNALHAQIVALTNAMCAPGDINGEETIEVRLRRPTGPTFAVIDVPGITCLSGSLENPNHHIEAETVALTNKMIGTNASTIVVVVLPATEDFGNSKALSLIERAGVADRTIAVVTKIDNLPPGSNLKERMSPEFCDKYAQLGIFAVRNRTQLEADQRMSLDLLPELEAKAFRDNPALAALPEEQKGLSRFLDKLAAGQRRLMVEFVPMLKDKANAELVIRMDRYAQLPVPLKDDKEKEKAIFIALRKIEKYYEGCMKGDAKQLHFPDESPAQLSALVKHALKQMHIDMLKKMPLFLDDATMQRIEKAATLQGGYELSVHEPNRTKMFQTEWATSASHVLNDAAKVYPWEVAQRVINCIDTIVDSSDELKRLDAPKLRAALKKTFKEAVFSRFRLAQTWAVDMAAVENEIGCRQTQNPSLDKAMEAYDAWDKKPSTYPASCNLPEPFFKSVCATHSLAGDNKGNRPAARRAQAELHHHNNIVRERFVDTLAIQIRKKIVVDTLADIEKVVFELPHALVGLVDAYPAHAAKEAKKLEDDIERYQSVLAKLDMI